MDVTSAIGSVFAAFGLSGAAGLNAWIPLFATGLGQRLDVIHLKGAYSDLGSTPALIVIGIALVADFVGDKIPAFDHVLHSIGAVVHPAAGAIVFAGQTGAETHLPPVVALLAGSAIAGSFHATRAAVRPVSTATTAGLGNPVLSLAEDAISIGLTVFAFVLPVLAFAAVAIALVAIVLSFRRLRARWRARRATPAEPAAPV